MSLPWPGGCQGCHFCSLIDCFRIWRYYKWKSIVMIFLLLIVEFPGQEYNFYIKYILVTNAKSSFLALKKLDNYSFKNFRITLKLCVFLKEFSNCYTPCWKLHPQNPMIANTFHWLGNPLVETSCFFYRNCCTKSEVIWFFISNGFVILQEFNILIGKAAGFVYWVQSI